MNVFQVAKSLVPAPIDLNVEIPDLLPQRIAVEAQEIGGANLIAARCRQRRREPREAPAGSAKRGILVSAGAAPAHRSLLSIGTIRCRTSSPDAIHTPEVERIALAWWSCQPPRVGSPA